MTATAPEPAREGWHRSTRLGASLDSLTARLVLASTALAAVVGGVFVTLAFAVSDLSSAAGREAQAKDVVEATVVVQKLVVDVETSVRGFAITADERFLRPMREAQAELPQSLDALVRGASGDPDRLRAATELADLIRAYVEEYAIPIVEIARVSPAAARSETARQEARLRTDEISSRLAEFLAGERRRAATTAASAKVQARRAIALGIGGVAASMGMILLLGAYLIRSIGRPVQEVAVGARRIARGDLSLRLDERGPGEIGSLTRAFNAMAADLADRQRTLEVQNARLRESERLKSELVSIVSHEIRTPLASILGFASVLLEREVDDADRRRYLQIIGAEGRRLASLLDDLLDVQRLEEGLLELALGRVDLSSLVRTQAALFSAESEKHTLDVRLPVEPMLLEGDAGRLAQVVSNLISNAIKYSPEGGPVEITGEEDNGVVRIRVRDEGFGIPPEAHGRIFTKFFRGQAAVSGIPGSGLGLAVTRSVVEAHGGSIDFRSTVGEGTTFSVELPKHQGDAPTRETGERG